MADSPHVLDLTSTTPRNTVRIDGVPYVMRSAEDLYPRQHREMARLYNRLVAIENQATVSEADDIETMTLLGQIAMLALVDLPAAVLEQLRYPQRSELAVTFFKLSGTALKFLRATPPPPPAAPSQTASGSPGTTSSRAASGSTAARRRSGTRSRSE